MSESDRIRWEKKHANAGARPLGEAEATLEWAPFPSGPARALDLACGRGRNCGALLRRGYKVIAVDVAGTALRELRQRYRDARGQLFPVQADLDFWPFAPDSFDLILQCDFLDRRLFPEMKASTRRGGYVLIDTFGLEDTAETGPRNLSFRLEPDELGRIFWDWEIVRRESRRSPVRESILARRPFR